MSIQQLHVCDGPNCTQETAAPEDWIMVIPIGAEVNPAHTARFDSKTFHNEACLEAYLAE